MKLDQKLPLDLTLFEMNDDYKALLSCEGKKNLSFLFIKNAGRHLFSNINFFLIVEHIYLNIYV